jgi:GNAT superfamily N-acetyltransferase
MNMFEKPGFYYLKNNLQVFVRLFRPSDIQQVVTGFDKLSERSRYRRFFSSPNQLPETSVKDLLTMDNINRLALCAGVILKHGWEGAGIARFTRHPSNPASAELALTIIDKYQRLGLGSLLFELLRQKAIECGITRFTGIILTDNTSMLKILNHYPIESSQVITGPAIHLEIKLCTDSPIEVVTFEYNQFTENHTPIGQDTLTQ